jgi:hypothetical protein
MSEKRHHFSPCIVSWFMIAIAVTCLCGLVYLTVQQSYRMGANDPQVQMAEDAAASLEMGQEPVSFAEKKIDIAQSLAPFLIVYDNKGSVITSSAMLDGNTPQLPSGIFDSVNASGEDRFTWQPAAGVRVAAVVARYKGIRSGYILVGRSLREVEKREDRLLWQVELAWAVTVLVIGITAGMYLLLVKKHR